MAVQRWEAILGRPAPPPTSPGLTGTQRLAPAFVEWLMSLPEGWVTGIDLPRNAQLRLLGNGVVTLQAACALTYLLGTVQQLRQSPPEPEQPAVTVEVPDELPAINDQAAALLLRMLIEHRPNLTDGEPFG